MGGAVATKFTERMIAEKKYSQIIQGFELF